MQRVILYEKFLHNFPGLSGCGKSTPPSLDFPQHAKRNPLCLWKTPPRCLWKKLLEIPKIMSFCNLFEINCGKPCPKQAFYVENSWKTQGKAVGRFFHIPGRYVEKLAFWHYFMEKPVDKFMEKAWISCGKFFHLPAKALPEEFSSRNGCAGMDCSYITEFVR